MRFLQCTEVSERPCHGIAIPFVVADSFVDPAGRGSEDIGDVTSHAGLFGDADNQDSRYVKGEASEEELSLGDHPLGEIVGDRGLVISVDQYAE